MECYFSEIIKRTSGGPVAETLCYQCRGPGLILGQETRSHMPQTKSSHAATKRSHILHLRPNKYILKIMK